MDDPQFKLDFFYVLKGAVQIDLELGQVQQVLNETRNAEEFEYFKEYSTTQKNVFSKAMLLENQRKEDLSNESDPMAATQIASSPIRFRQKRKSTQMSRRSSDEAGTRLKKRGSHINLSRLQKEEGALIEEVDDEAAFERKLDE